MGPSAISAGEAPTTQLVRTDNCDQLARHKLADNDDRDSDADDIV